MRIMTLDDLSAVDPIARPLWTRTLAAAARVWLRAPRELRIALEGPMPRTSRPVIYAVNHTHAYDFLPFRAFLYRRGHEAVTWIKPRAWTDGASGAVFSRTGNVPVASRGSVIAADAHRVWGRRPSDDEYRALRDHVDVGGRLPDTPGFRAILRKERDLLGLRFDPRAHGYRDAVHELFRQMMQRTLALSAREDGHPTYVCLACESGFDVQHHSCPVCGSYDLRRARWVTD